MAKPTKQNEPSITKKATPPSKAAMSAAKPGAAKAGVVEKDKKASAPVPAQKKPQPVAAKAVAVQAPAKPAAPKKAEPPQKVAPAKKVEAVKTPPPVKSSGKGSESAKAPAKSSAKKPEIPSVSTARKTGLRTSLNILPKDFLFDLGMAIRDAVAPLAREGKGREIVSTAPTGDATFEIDRVAEKTLLNFLKNARAPIAYYSEDAGYSTFSNMQPENLLVVDPIDGTRAAKNGFEGCVVSIASTRVIERPTMADVDNACVIEILGNRSFYAERGKGARMFEGDQQRKIKLSTNFDREQMTWSMTVPARPAGLIFPIAANLIDISALKGGFFSCNSSSYSLTRLLTAQLDAYVDVAHRFMRDIPDLVRDKFVNAGRGSVIGAAPYDFAAALLIAQEAGCIVTDAYGKKFNDVLLLDSSETNHQSILAASNKTLHAELLRYFNEAIEKHEQLYRRLRG